MLDVNRTGDESTLSKRKGSKEEEVDRQNWERSRGLSDKPDFCEGRNPLEHPFGRNDYRFGDILVGFAR